VAFLDWLNNESLSTVIISDISSLLSMVGRAFHKVSTCRPRLSTEPHRLESGYDQQRLLSVHTLPLRHLNNTHLAPIVARNVNHSTRRTANMASKQLLSPLRRAVLQKIHPNSSICVQCQRRWQSKVSQRPGSDRYMF
jgi:hypothetical protein